MEEKFDLGNIYRISEDIVAREIEGELVIVPLISGIGDMEDDLFTLNETGRAIWNKINGKNSLEKIAHSLIEEYEVRFPIIKEDIAGLIRELLKRKIINKVNDG